MFKRTILATAVAALTMPAVNAAPFQPIDARGLAMGGTGVASAQRAHAPAYNPSLLAQKTGHKDRFALLFPQFGVMVGDEKAISDEVKDIGDIIFPRFEELVTEGNGALDKRIENLFNSIDNFKTTTDSTSINSSSSKADLLQAITDLKEGNSNIGSSAAGVQTNFTDINSTVNDLSKSLNNISGNPISARLGVNGAIAIPGKTLAAAVSVKGTANLSAKLTMSPSDLDLLGAYVPAAQGFVTKAQGVSNTIDGQLETLENNISSIDENSSTAAADITQAIADFNNTKGSLQNEADGLKGYTSPNVKALGNNPVIKDGKISEFADDPVLSSIAEVIAIGIIDVGISFASEFDIAGEQIAIGITPKIQKIYTAHYGNEIDNFDDTDSDVIEESRRDYTAFNLDVGASYQFGEMKNWMAGVVIHNLFGGSYKFAPTRIVPHNNPGAAYDLDGGKVNLNPQVRGGVAYSSKWVKVAFDLDLLKNKPIAFEQATQYAAIGGELDIFHSVQLRAGYRTNLQASGANTISAGIGLSPFGVHLDITGMVNPSDAKKDVGAALDMGFYF